MSNILIIINILIKFNFGFSYSLIKYSKINIDNNYLLINNFIVKYMFIYNNYLNYNNNKKKNYFYFKCLLKILKKNITYNYKNLIKKIFLINLRYINYCYKGIFLKIFKTKK
jgi:hypothetical protein